MQAQELRHATRALSHKVHRMRRDVVQQLAQLLGAAAHGGQLLTVPDCLVPLCTDAYQALAQVCVWRGRVGQA